MDLIEACRDLVQLPIVQTRLKDLHGRRRLRKLNGLMVADTIERLFRRAEPRMVTTALNELSEPVMVAMTRRGSGLSNHGWGSVSETVDLGYFPEHKLLFMSLSYVSGRDRDAEWRMQVSGVDFEPTYSRLWHLLRPEVLCFSVQSPIDGDSAGQWSFAWLQHNTPLQLLRSTSATPTLLPPQDFDLPLVEETFSWLTLNEIATPRVATVAPLRVLGQDERSWCLSFLARKLHEHGPGPLTKDLIRQWNPRLLDRPWISEVLSTPKRWQDLQALIQPKPAIDWTLRVLPWHWKGKQRLTPLPSWVLRLEGRPTLWRALLGESTERFHPASLRRKVNEVAKQSTHPVTLDTAGWVRFTVQTRPKPQFIIEEVQSDLHQAWFQIAGYKYAQLNSWFSKEMGLVNEADFDQLRIGLRELSERFRFINSHLFSAVLDLSRAHGYPTVLFPTVTTRQKFGGQVPREIYDDLPRRYGAVPTPPTRVTDLGYEYVFHQLTVGVEATITEPKQTADQELADDYEAWADNLDLWLTRLPLVASEVWREDGRTFALFVHAGHVWAVEARTAYVWWQEGGGSIESLAQRGKVSTDLRHLQLFGAVL